nr:stealth family protein [uncultured Eisenbergiella sp.]
MKEREEQIDFVIIWVDGADKQWQDEKNKYIPNINTDDREIRYRDYNNLKYWFRGVERFAPWVHKIYFVTYGHLPSWLEINNNKLVIVNHNDFIPKQYLPTFSSHPIEINLHRIKGLSEKFVYFNDDMFILRKVKKTDFFYKGLPRDSAVINAHPSIKNTLHISETNMEIINDHFHKKDVLLKNPLGWFNIKYGTKLLRTICLLPWPEFIGLWDHHLASSFLKCTFKELWEREYGILNDTSTHKFRYAMDVNQWLFRYWQIVKGNFYPRATTFGKSFCLQDDNIVNEKIYSSIKNQKYKLICINDGIEKKIHFEMAKQKIIESFECILPYKSSFEK